MRTKETDLEKFCRIFRLNHKTLSGNRLLFKVKDLDARVAEARQIINKNNLNLTIINNADMASYNAFEVTMSSNP